MAEGHRMTAADLVDKLLQDEHADVLRDSVAWLVTQLMEAEVGALTGAGLGERAPDRRQTQRNGYRPRAWDTRVGELELAIPKLRQGSYCAIPVACGRFDGLAHQPRRRGVPPVRVSWSLDAPAGRRQQRTGKVRQWSRWGARAADYRGLVFVVATQPAHGGGVAAAG
jgi:Transposase, Mutator family